MAWYKVGFYVWLEGVASPELRGKVAGLNVTLPDIVEGPVFVDAPSISPAHLEVAPLEELPPPVWWQGRHL